MSELKDPRVLFAAERTLLAWNRTSLTLMAFGFVIERFGLFVHVLLPASKQHLERDVSFWVGMAFVFLGSCVSAVALMQYRRVLKTLTPAEIPEGYHTQLGVLVNAIVAALGILLIFYLFFSL